MEIVVGGRELPLMQVTTSPNSIAIKAILFLL